MTHPRLQIVVLGATGSIGTGACEVIAADPQRFALFAATGHKNLDRLKEIATDLRPQFVVATDEEAAGACDWSTWPSDAQMLRGEDAICELVARPEVDVVVAAMVGSVGLQGAWAALEAGKRLALANKETLVAAGPLFMNLARERGAEIIPVDSEHSAIFQSLAAGRRQDVRRIVLTASGGPFRTWTAEQLEQARVEDALKHPTWEMGAKITVDSATMMNKALEMIEARWLFDMPAEAIDVVVHPQSTVHSFVEFVDGSVIAQMGPPDMKLPIQYALTHPWRSECPARKLDFQTACEWSFEPPDEERFPALALGREAAAAGGTAGAVLNAANEAAVAAFLTGEIGFTQITAAARAVLEAHDFDPRPTLTDILHWDQWARQEATRWAASV